MSLDIHTPQEHRMIGSSINKKYLERPYMPLAVFDKEFSPEECNRQRRTLEEWMTCFGIYFGNVGLAHIALEELDLNLGSSNYGCTIRDPQFIRWVLISEKCEKEEIPYRRNNL